MRTASTSSGCTFSPPVLIETEPLPSEHPLWDEPRLVITPHVAGHRKNTDVERQALIVDNAERFAGGRPLRNVVDKKLRF